jgi:8-oxo-dGTP pyrophosphatase MutT (NUDIX family)
VRRIRKQADLGERGRIIIKCNHLVDPQIIEELYEASRAGVEIDLIVRGVCCLRPELSGLSERIRVRSIVGKYLEHSRIFRFGSGENVEYLIGSADLMPRNLDGRVEATTPVKDPDIGERLEEILRVNLADDLLAWELRADGTWARVTPSEGINAHVRFEELGKARARGAPPDARRASAGRAAVMAAGGIIHRRDGKGRTEVFVVHRPKYDDWSFPKGKLAAGETEAEGALREVFEETGFDCALGPELGSIEYADALGIRKVVRYWAMVQRGGRFTANQEVDEGRWVTVPDAAVILTYPRDRALVRSLEGAIDE